MSNNQKGFVIIASLIIVIVTGGMIIKTIHKNNVNKEKEEDYQIISKKIKSNEWEKNIKSKNETYNSKMGRPEIQVIYKDKPKVTYEYSVISENGKKEVLGAATTNSDRSLKKSDEKYQTE